ncbi:hypothetical protein LJB42_000868 [Komagataella kurtzmanii]|nr:hypothetical protein LJB42_000868 [Komagataella kurtzmanii]
MQPVSVPALPKGYNLRRVGKEDFQDKNLFKTLSILTTVGDIPEPKFHALIEYWNDRKEIYNPMVITNAENVIIATGMLFVEHKLIHGGGKVGHIEDISVNPSEQGKKLGLIMIRNLIQIAQTEGCYKVILDCDEKNVRFYEKCGMKIEGVEMGYRF